jgi:fumarate reductase subunit D
MKRSNKPIFWSLFGAGGMLSALIGPVLIFITGIAVPLGLIPREAMGYERMRVFAQNGFGKVAIVLVIGLFLFHGLHRMYHSPP